MEIKQFAVGSKNVFSTVYSLAPIRCFSC